MSEMRMVAAGGVRGTDHAAHFGGVFAGKGFVGLVCGVCAVSLFCTKRTLPAFSLARVDFIKSYNKIKTAVRSRVS